MSDYDFASAELDYRAGGWSTNALAVKHSIPEPTLRRYAKRHGWIKGSSEAKRELVREAMAGTPLDDSQVTNGVTNDEAGSSNDERAMTNDEKVRQIQIQEAAQDVADMTTGLQVARACMGKLLTMVEQVEHPRDVKLIVEANRGAVETIRKIRSLDDEEGPETAVTVQVGDDGLAELRAAFKKRLEVMQGQGA